MQVKVKSNIKEVMRKLRNVPRKYVQKALVTSLNKVGAEVVTQAKRELKEATGLKAGVIGKKIKKDKARKGDETYSIHIKSRYLNAIEFGARQTKKGVSAKIWGVRKVYRGAFIGSGRNSGKQLVFKKSKTNPKRIKALHGASLPREFERQDMAKLFNKKIKTRFPILFKRALDFHLMKARGSIG
jgi:ADP-ribose pyrophosphatase YjhB (NUDIX family)